MFSSEYFGFDGVEDQFSCSEKVWERMDEMNGGKHLHFNAEADRAASGFGFYQKESPEEGFLLSKYQQQEMQHVSLSGYGLIDDLQFHFGSPRRQTCLEEISKLGESSTLIPYNEPKNRNQQPFSLLLNSSENRFKALNNGDRIVEQSNGMPRTKVEDRKLSTEEILRLAGAKFIQSSSQTADCLSTLSHPFEFAFNGLSNEENDDSALAEFLFASAEKVGFQQFDRANKFLNQCDCWSSKTGNPVQRVVFYFTKALREKIDRETGRIAPKDLGIKSHCIDVDQVFMSPSPPMLASHEKIPFSQLAQFTGIQAIVEHMADARKIHVIDLGIRHGVQWTILMQALATRYECPLELLKITAVGTTSKHLLVETGKRLESFSQSLNLPFSFKVVMISDMLDLRKDLFELDANERVAVYSAYLLRIMIPWPNQLESIMKVVRSINPCIMVVTEVEANHNSPAFVSRFVEALFFFGAYFDCLETFMKRDDPNRMVLESLFFGEGIRNIVAAEGEERSIRNVKIDVWRAFFARYGMLETELSMSSLYQARLVVKKFDCENSCTLDMNGKCMIIGWKGTPICSLSAWKFLSQ